MGKDKRFTIDEKGGLGFVSNATIIVDNETGVNYLFVNIGVDRERDPAAARRLRHDEKEGSSPRVPRNPRRRRRKE